MQDRQRAHAGCSPRWLPGESSSIGRRLVANPHATRAVGRCAAGPRCLAWRSVRPRPVARGRATDLRNGSIGPSRSPTQARVRQDHPGIRDGAVRTAYRDRSGSAPPPVRPPQRRGPDRSRGAVSSCGYRSPLDQRPHPHIYPSRRSIFAAPPHRRTRALSGTMIGLATTVVLADVDGGYPIMLGCWWWPRVSAVAWPAM